MVGKVRKIAIGMLMRMKEGEQEMPRFLIWAVGWVMVPLKATGEKWDFGGVGETPGIFF